MARDRGRNRGTARLVLLVISLGIMIATGAAQMLWISGTRLVAGAGPECAPLRAVSGAVLRIHCHETGFQRARIVGVSVPDFFAPACREEWLAGIGAWWFLQTELSKARTIRMRFQDDGDARLREVHLFLDGDSAARMLLREGHAAEGLVPGNWWCSRGGTPPPAGNGGSRLPQI